MIYFDFGRKEMNLQVLLLKNLQSNKQLEVDFYTKTPYNSAIS